MGQMVPACNVADVEPGRGVAVDLDGLRVAIFNDGGTFHALFGRCPHAGGPLGRGWLEEGAAVCPLHGWRFRLRDGRCLTDRGYSISTFRCEVRDGRVLVEV